jgi:hypothetical protein
MCTVSVAGLPRRRFGPPLAAVVLAILFVLGACGSSKDTFKSSKGKATTTSGESSVTTTTEGGAPPGSGPGTDAVNPSTTLNAKNDPALAGLLLDGGEVGAGWTTTDEQATQDLTEFCDGVHSPTKPDGFRARGYTKGKAADTSLLFTGVLRFANEDDASGYLNFFPTAAKKCGVKFTEVTFKPLPGVGDEALRGTTAGTDFVAFRTGRTVGLATLVSATGSGPGDKIAARMVTKIKAGS